MIEVPIDKIIPLEDAETNFRNILETAKNENSLFIITKKGKPYAALIDIDYLEHLPEMQNVEKTQPIHTIGQFDNNTGEEIIEKKPIAEEQSTQQEPTEEQPILETIQEQTTQEQPIQVKQQPEEPIEEQTIIHTDNENQAFTENNETPINNPNNNENNDLYNENIGPWSENNQQKPQEEEEEEGGDDDEKEEPPDLPI